MRISNVQGLISYINQNSYFGKKTIHNVIRALGFSLKGTMKSLKQLSAQLENCAEHGADCGFCGFIYYNETIPFFTQNRQQIIKHMEQTAADMGTDIISMVQEFGTFRNTDRPSPSEIGRALWDISRIWEDLTSLYNVFAWYALEEIANTWYRYLEDNPVFKPALPA